MVVQRLFEGPTKLGSDFLENELRYQNTFMSFFVVNKLQKEQYVFMPKSPTISNLLHHFHL